MRLWLETSDSVLVRIQTTTNLLCGRVQSLRNGVSHMPRVPGDFFWTVCARGRETFLRE